MIYPIEPCETQPRVPIVNVTLRNINIRGGPISFLNRWHIGIVRCNETMPCENIVFDNVNVDGWLGESTYICENVYG